MKKVALGLFTIATLAVPVHADDASTTAAAPPSHASSAAPVPSDSTAAPGDGFKPARYESLWTKSPFSVATPDSVEESPDYALVGVAQVDGVFYASLVQKQNSAHFVLSSDKPINGLSLTSVTKGQTSADTTALLMRDGQPLSLKLEQAPLNLPPPPQPMTFAGQTGTAQTIAVPQGGTVQNIQMPGANQNPGGQPNRPLIRIHRSAIHLPPRTEQAPPTPAPAAAPQTPPPAPAQ